MNKRTEGATDHIDQTGCPSNMNGLKSKSNGSEASVRNSASFMEGTISVEEILCPHGRLDPGKAVHMKRIDRVRPNRKAILSY